MVEWSKLKPLRYHRNILTLLVVVQIVLLIYLPGKNSRRSNDRNGNISAEVTATSGLIIRERPDVSSVSVGSVPYHGKVKVLDGNEVVGEVNGVKGYWYMIEYNGTKGYVWGKFLK